MKKERLIDKIVNKADTDKKLGIIINAILGQIKDDWLAAELANLSIETLTELNNTLNS